MQLDPYRAKIGHDVDLAELLPDFETVDDARKARARLSSVLRGKV